MRTSASAAERIRGRGGRGVRGRRVGDGELEQGQGLHPCPPCLGFPRPSVSLLGAGWQSVSGCSSLSLSLGLSFLYFHDEAPRSASEHSSLPAGLASSPRPSGVAVLGSPPGQLRTSLGSPGAGGSPGRARGRAGGEGAGSRLGRGGARAGRASPPLRPGPAEPVSH